MKCSLCGGQVIVSELLMNPGIRRYDCQGCGARREDVLDRDDLTVDMGKNRAGRVFFLDAVAAPDCKITFETGGEY